MLYHRVTHLDSDPWSLSVSPQHFAEHLQVLRKYSPIRLSEIQSAGEPSRKKSKLLVAVTFDDGYGDNIDEAVPLLKKYEIPATFFVATGYIGGSREFWWDALERTVFHSDSKLPPLDLTAGDRRFFMPPSRGSSRKELYLALYEFLQPLSHECRLDTIDQLYRSCHQPPLARSSHRVMTMEELKKLASTELLEIGAHSVTHPVLSRQPSATQRTEIVQSKAFLDDLLGRCVVSFSYPYGAPHHYTRETVEIVRESGFMHGCTTAGRRVQSTDSNLELPRINITDMDGNVFEKLLSQ